MIRKSGYFSGLSILVVLVLMGFSSFETKQTESFRVENNEIVYYHYPNENTDEMETSDITIPYVGKTFVGFRQALAFKESRGILNCVNSYGYMGKYQFGKSTLRTVGIYDFNTFLKNEVWQEKAFRALLSIHKWILRKEIEKYDGKILNGVKITESGILAAAHLGGAGSVKKFLRSNGRNGFQDGYGTSLKSYFKKFGGYDVSIIEAKKDAKVDLE